MIDREQQLANSMVFERMQLEADAQVEEMLSGTSTVFPEEQLPGYLRYCDAVEAGLMRVLQDPGNVNKLRSKIEKSSESSRVRLTASLVEGNIGWYLINEAAKYFETNERLKFIWMFDLHHGLNELMSILVRTEDEAKGGQKETAKALGETVRALSMIGLEEATIGAEEFGKITERQRQRVEKAREERTRLLNEDPSGVKLMERIIEAASNPDLNPDFVLIANVVHPREFSIRGAQIAKKAYELIYPLTEKAA